MDYKNVNTAMKKMFWLFLLVLGLGACGVIFPHNPDDYPRNPSGLVTRHGYREAVESWMGAPVEEVIASWGKPDGITPATESDSLMEYVWHRVETVEGDFQCGYYEGSRWVSECGWSRETYGCTTVLRVHSRGDTKVVLVEPDSFLENCEKMSIPPARSKPTQP
jgi:hypothetical protein